MADPIRPEEPKAQFYVQGRQVWSRSVTTQREDGTSSVTMGFPVCTASQFVDGAAEHIAKALNLLETTEAQA